MATASSTVRGTLTFSFLFGLQEYHEYRCMWSPELNEVHVLPRNTRNDLVVMEHIHKNKQAFAIMKSW